MEDFKKIAHFAEELSFGNLSAQTVEAAKRILLDSIACMAAGNRLLNKVDASGLGHLVGPCTIVGSDGGFGKEWSAFVNGTNMVATEMDEGNQFAKGHPAAHFLPALLGEAEYAGISGRDFITAFIAAYEVAARIGSAIQLQNKVHPHGNWGTAGAAVAIAKLRMMNRQEIQDSLVLGASLPVTSVWASALSGANVRNAYIGISNLIGLLAPDMVRNGIRSNSTVLMSLYSEVLGAGFVEEFLAEGLGTDYWIEKNYFKIYACCRFIHGAVDCVLGIKEQLQSKNRTLSPESIKRVHVETYNMAATLDAYEPPNGFAAKFSIPFSMAILLCKDSVAQEEFHDGNVNDSFLKNFSRRVVVSEDARLTSLLPKTRATRVTIQLTDGTIVSNEVHVTTGDPENPLKNGDLMRKFYELAVPTFEESKCSEIANVCFSIDTIGNIAEFTRLLRR